MKSTIQFIKDLAKILGVILGLALVMMFVGWLLGGKSERNNIDYYIKQYESPADLNYVDNNNLNL